MPNIQLAEDLLIAAQTCYLRVGQGATHRWEVLRAAGALEPLWGQRALQALGADALQLAPAEDRQALAAALEQSARGVARATAPLRLLHARGHVLWCLATIAACDDEEGCAELLLKPLEGQQIARQGFSGASRIIEDSDFFQRIVETVNDGLLVNSPTGEIIFLNQRLASMLGYQVQELLGVPILSLMDEEEQRATLARLANRKGGQEEVFDCRWMHRSGAPVWTQASARPLINTSGQHIGSVVALTDITQRKQAEAALQGLTEELERRVEERTRELEHEVAVRRAAEDTAVAASRAKSTFLANMSHELRTPLNAIIGYVELLREDLEEAEALAPQTGQDLERIRYAASHLLELISGVLDLSRVEAGRVELELREVDVVELIGAVTASAGGLMARGGNRFVVERPTPLPLMITDITKLRQILLNGLSNAAKFTRDGAIWLRATYDASADELVFTVEDTGEGISQAALARIFEPFMQEDSSSTRRVDGAGLGLAISRQFAELLGGSLTLSSVKYQGTTFELRLPRQAGAR